MDWLNSGICCGREWDCFSRPGPEVPTGLGVLFLHPLSAQSAGGISLHSDTSLFVAALCDSSFRNVRDFQGVSEQLHRLVLLMCLR